MSASAWVNEAASAIRALSHAASRIASGSVVVLVGAVVVGGVVVLVGAVVVGGVVVLVGAVVVGGAAVPVGAVVGGAILPARVVVDGAAVPALFVGAPTGSRAPCPAQADISTTVATVIAADRRVMAGR
jgi:hypothetical protein